MIPLLLSSFFRRARLVVSSVRVSACIGALSFMQPVGGVASEASPSLFLGDVHESERRLSGTKPSMGAVKRERRTRLNAGLFVGPAARTEWVMSRLKLNLFPEMEPTVVMARTETLGPGRWVGHGHVENQPGSHFTLAVDQEVIAATVFMPGRGAFRMVSEGDDRCSISEIDPSRIGRCGSDDGAPAVSLPGGVRKSVNGPAAPGLQSLQSLAPANTNLVTIVDVMVVYTAEARTGAGGATALSTLIDLAMAEANTVFQNSSASVRLRLAFRGEVDYVEDPSIATNLNRLRLKDDGFMDQIHALRETNSADVVCLITEHGEPGIAGQAFTMTDPSSGFRVQAFSVVQRSEAIGTYIFAHEISHNLGCQHDREHSFDAEGKPLSGAYSYSHGYRFTVGATTYRTVMAYLPGVPIPYLSNPNILFQGVPIGLPGTTNGANNTLTINNTAPIVGAYYGPPIRTVPPTVKWNEPVPESLFRSGVNLGLMADAGDSDGRLRQVEFYADNLLVGVAVNMTPVTTNQTGSSTAPYGVIWTNVPPGEHRLTARSVDALGASSVSIPARIIVRPANDDFAGRQPITGTTPVTVSGSTRAGTVEAGEATHAGNPGGRSVWYSWQAPRAGTVYLTVAGLGITPLPEVYRSVTAASLTSITRDIEFEKGTFTTRAAFALRGAVTYSIAVDASGGAEGEFTLGLAYQASPVNDDFANRTLLTGESFSLSTTNVASTFEAGEPVHTGNPGGKSVWFGWRAPKAGSVLVTASAADFFPLAEIYLINATNAMPTNIAPRAVVFSQTNKMTTITFNATAGQDYALVVDGLGGLSGMFDLALGYAAPPVNDDFAGRMALIGTKMSFETDNRYASREAGEPYHVSIKDEKTQGRKSVWYSWVAPVSGPVTVTARGDGFYPLPDVYTGETLLTLTNVPRRTVKFETTNTLSTLTFIATAFRAYVFALDGFDGRGGTIQASLATEFSPPSAELFSLSTPSKANFRLRLFGSARQNYVVQASTNLTIWTDIFIGTFETNSAAFTDESSGKYDHRYYRVLSLP